jgi:hypothetical protein
MERVGIMKSPWQKQISGTFLTLFNSRQLRTKEETPLCRLSTLFPRLVKSYFIHSLMYEFNGLAINETSVHCAYRTEWSGDLCDLLKWNANSVTQRKLYTNYNWHLLNVTQKGENTIQMQTSPY